MRIFREQAIKQRLLAISAVTGSGALVLACAAFIAHDRVALIILSNLLLVAFLVILMLLLTAQGELEKRVEERTRELKQEIAERTRAEEALRESDQRYRAFVEHISEGIWRFELEEPFSIYLPADEQIKLFYQNAYLAECNNMMAQMYGIPSAEEILGARIGDLLPQTDPRNLEALYAFIHSGYRLDDMETIETTAEGGSKYFANSLVGIIKDGLLIRVWGNQLDITERKLAEKALQESEERFRSLFENSPVGIYRTTPDGRIMMANPALIRMMGCSSFKELASYNLEADGTESTYSRAQFKARLEADDQIIGLEAVWKTRSGSSLYARENARVIRDVSGEILYYEGTIEDISERKRAEKEIAFLAQAIKSTRECVSITDIEDYIFFVNDAFIKTYGYTREELIGKHISIVRSERGAQEIEKAIRPRTLEGNWQGELLNRKKDGTEFPISLSTSMIRDPDGKPFALLGVAQDITERKRAEADLQKAKEAAEAASRAKSEFLANMSHEIRTPMNGIIGMTELALDTGLTQEQREYLTLVKISADSLLSVINDILDFSKIEAGKMALDPIEFNLGDIIGEMVKTLAVRADEKRLELACHILPGVPVEVVGDPGRLRQVLVNLVGNAIKFTNEGEVIVQVETEEQTPDDVLLRFTILDTGIGIPVEKQSLIFEAFAQGDGSTTRKYGGTGLGLAISSQLAELMQGRIWVESPAKIRNPHSKDVGSAFHFTARFGLQKHRSANQSNPYIQEIFEQPVLVNETARASESLRVLVAEDNAVNSKLMTIMLEKRGYCPQLAANGIEALAALENEKFDLVLMDVQMPEMNGFEATAAIRQKELTTGNHIPIIALTAHAMKGDKERCIAAGMDAYLSKPVRAEELFQLIKSLIGIGIDSKTAAAAHEAVDSKALLDYFQTDGDLLGEIIDVFLSEYPGMLSELRAAAYCNDAKRLEEMAHRLKGSIGIFHAIPAYNAVSRLELMGRNADMDRAREAAHELENELECMKQALAALRVEQTI